ncbi:MAG: hypothetical protein AB1716_05380 [Planctomycetota bacterium]
MPDPAQPPAQDDPLRSRFIFGCPRCGSLLETERRSAGQPGNCPTCAARLTIPVPAADWSVPQAQLLDPDRQDPTPMHAYAASGVQAPRIQRGPGDKLEIECPRCGLRSPITDNNCRACGVPFTIEGVPTARPAGADGLAVAALVFGVLSMPLAAFVVPALVALALALASWARKREPTPSAPAIVGGVLAMLSLAVCYLMYM